MPRQVEWLERIPEALEELERFPAPVLDRAALERLLGLRRREAIRLMHRLGGFQAGKTFLVEREALRAKLQALATSPRFEQEAQRRRRLSQELDRLRREAAARRVEIPVRRGDRQVPDLPATIRLSAGRLEIEYSGPEDLLRQLYELAEAISADYENFQRIVV